jgi:hypothetical protein
VLVGTRNEYHEKAEGWRDERTLRLFIRHIRRRPRISSHSVGSYAFEKAVLGVHAPVASINRSRKGRQALQHAPPLLQGEQIE